MISCQGELPRCRLDSPVQVARIDFMGTVRVRNRKKPPRPGESGFPGGAAGVAGASMPLLFLAVTLCTTAGCSKERVNSSIYESMRYMSNQENAGNPRYDPDGIEEYEKYRSRREGYLEDLQEEPPPK